MELKKNVLDFIKWSSNEIGKFEEDNASQDMLNECQEKGIESPIEHLLYCAMKTVRILNSIDDSDPVMENGKFICKDNQCVVTGLYIRPQFKIGKYRADFLISYGDVYRNDKYTKREVVVECDSQKWHERDEKERRYEKRRDRYFQSRGYKVFHFTGSEILKSPMEIAVEVIVEVMDCKKEDLVFDSEIN